MPKPKRFLSKETNMARWYDCPICIGYCEEFYEDGKTICDSCGAEVWFGPAPEPLRKRLQRAGFWCEEVVCLREDGEIAINPAFNTQEEYDRWIAWNVIRLTAVGDQLHAFFRHDDEEEGNDEKG
jgi:hypothetical protein